MEQQEVTNKNVQPEQNSKMLMFGAVLMLIVVAGLIFAMRNSTATQDTNTPAENTAKMVEESTDEEQDKETVTVVYVETDAQRKARISAEARLREIEANIQGNTASEETLEAIIATRNSLRTSYADAEGEVKESWEETDAQLAQLEADVRDNTATAIDTLQEVLQRLKVEVQTNENNDDNMNKTQ